jgi:DNA-binding NarL/FixJ family response regulator
VESLDQAVKDLEQRTASIPQISPPKPGMTDSRRVQVLRMYKRGERTEQIAATLGLPLNEVDLLVKVHQLVNAG